MLQFQVVYTIFVLYKLLHLIKYFIFLHNAYQDIHLYLHYFILYIFYSWLQLLYTISVSYIYMSGSHHFYNRYAYFN